ncbi:MAG: coproporphyrinogen-III oxidase family protein, partial [Calditrichia bacterium]
RDLKFLGRIHTVDDVLENYESARKAGFENINLDLMTAFPGLTAERFQSTLEKAADLQPEHISCYTLIFEPNTPFFARMKRGELQPPDNEEEAAFYEAANSCLASRGYSVYEISNYSRTPELRCRHNLRYWNHEPYLGLGPSAHSFLIPQRWWNVRPLTAYIKKLSGNELPIQEQETLDAATLEFEYIFLRLRLKEGIDLSDFEKRFHNNFIQRYKKVVDSLLKNELVIQNEERLQLSDKGWLLADEIARVF